LPVWEAEAEELVVGGELFAAMPEHYMHFEQQSTLAAEMSFAAQPNRVLPDSVKIQLSHTRLCLTLEGIQQYYVMMDHEKCKLDKLLDLYKTLAVEQGVIYVGTNHKINWLANKMQENDISASCVYGEERMNQKERDRVLRDFRSGSSRVLITCDWAVRGMDVQDVASLVINYDMPTYCTSYLHRVGRRSQFVLGRRSQFDHKPVAICFIITEDDVDTMRMIESQCNTTIEELPMTFVYK